MMDVVFLLDESGSIQWENFPLLTTFAQAIINKLNVGEAVQVAAVSFGDDAHLHVKLNDYKDKHDVMHALDLIKYQGGTTNVEAALKMTTEKVQMQRNTFNIKPS